MSWVKKNVETCGKPPTNLLKQKKNVLYFNFLPGLINLGEISLPGTQQQVCPWHTILRGRGTIYYPQVWKKDIQLAKKFFKGPFFAS